MQQQLNLVKGIDKEELFDIKTVDDEGAFAVDQKGVFLYMNEEAERMLGWQSSEVLEKNIFEIIDFKVEAISTIGTSKCTALNSVGCAHLQTGAKFTRKDGLPLNVSYVTLPVFDQGKIVGKVYIIREQVRTEGIDQDAGFKYNETTYRAIVEKSISIIVKIDLTGVITFSNEYANQVFGDKIDLAIPSDVHLPLSKNPSTFTAPLDITNHAKTSDDRVIHISWAISPDIDKRGKVIGAILVGNNISNYEEQTKNTIVEKALVHGVFDHISDGIVAINDDGRVTYVNPAAEQYTGWSNSDAIGLHLKDVFHVIDERTSEPIVDSLIRRTYEGKSNSITTTCMLVRRDGWEFIIAESSTTVRDQQGCIIGAVIVFRDISELHGLERWMAFEPPQDSLTGLMSRTEFESHLSRAITGAKATSSTHALYYVDINNYQRFKQQHGEQAGNGLLKKVSTLVSVKARDTDMLGRIEEDGFGVLLEKCTIENARESAQAVCNEINDYQFKWENKVLKFSVSIGLIPITATSCGVDALIRTVDAACYVAKHKGYKKIHAYKAKDIAFQENSDDLEWMTQIRRALAEDMFRLYCQTIVPVKDPEPKVNHHEILLRLEQDDGEIIKPRTFMSAAERYDLMPSIDRWVVKKALTLLSERIKKKDKVGIYFINISAQSLNDENFLKFVIDQFDKTKVPAEKICFEITETTAISNLTSATRFMSNLRDMGCKLSLDDFGRGFSSYAYLKNLQIDYLKIGGTFVRDVATDAVDHAMVESINQIGHIMGLQTIAEFVESKAALDKLTAIGIDYVQGYQLGKPIPMCPSVSPTNKTTKKLEPAGMS